ncbi:MAG: homoserine O-acetyltransferase/O-succinyltransferase [Candidatus Sumerlaeota bacterium]|nr:homoserine O-acetyltransferase/O-succinyltransferase [Candidatus Sumerlaeota bacterium]
MTSKPVIHPSHTQFLEVATREEPFVLQNGSRVGPVTIAYKTYGTLNASKTNAILIFHALSGSQHVTGFDPYGVGRFWGEECQIGWWSDFVGPGKAIDTDKFFVLCCNYFGGCYGSTGPADINPETGKPYGREFPYPTVSDIVDTQVRVLDALGIETLLAAIGGSMGGFAASDLAVRYPTRVRGVIPIASGLRATVLAKALNFEQIYAIAEDRHFNGGDYYEGKAPWRGLLLARMISHKTFISLDYLERRAREVIIQPTDILSGHLLEHKVESYMLHQGRKFIERFDANSYLRIITAWQSFDLPKTVADGDVTRALSACKDQRWLVFSIDSDVCFYPREQKEISDGLKANGIEHWYLTVHSDKGHDSFLLEPELFSPHIVFMLAALEREYCA